VYKKYLKKKLPFIGDYVVATRWSDRDALDPWVVGYVTSYNVGAGGRRYFEVNGKWWENCWGISEKVGKMILSGAVVQ